MWRLKNNILLQMESWIWRKKTQNTIILESETKNRVVQRLPVILVCSHSALLYISGYKLVRQPKKCRYIHTLYTYQENYRAWIFCLVFHALWSQQQFSSTFFLFPPKQPGARESEWSLASILSVFLTPALLLIIIEKIPRTYCPQWFKVHKKVQMGKVILNKYFFF